MSMNFTILHELALAQGFTALELVTTRTVSCSLRAVAGEITDREDTARTTATLVGTLPLADGLHLGRMAFDGTEEDPLRLLSDLRDQATLMPAGATTELVAPGSLYAKPRGAHRAFGSASEKEQVLEDLLASLAKEPGITGIPEASYDDVRMTRTLVNSRGLSLADNWGYASLSAEAIAEGHGDLKVGSDYALASSTRALDARALSARIALRARSMLGATQIASGSYPLVLDRQASSALLATFASCFSGENAIRQLTPFAGKEGQAIGSPLVTIYDDILEGRYGRRVFDDEGMPTQKTMLMDRGIFTSFYDSRKTAAERGTSSTGNGFGGQCAPGLFRMKNGTTPIGRLMSFAEGGVLVTSLEGLHAGANPLTGDFNCQASGYRIRSGKRAEPLNLMVLSGSFASLLHDVALVGNDRDEARDGCAPSLALPHAALSGK